jgi:hypothetical protein
VKSFVSLALVTLAVCASSATAAGTTIVSCLNAKGFEIGWYNPDSTQANGDSAPTILPIHFDFAKAGISNYSVVKGRLPVEGPKGPPPNSPLLNVEYLPHPNGKKAKDLVPIGHFIVAWQREPQAAVNVALDCVRRYA